MNVGEARNVLTDQFLITGPQGPKGDPGADSQQPGPPGPRGEPGRDAEPQKPAMTWRGTYSASKKYEKGDVVEFQGSSYICVTECRGRQPGSKCWALLASKGKDGQDGIGQRGRRGQDGIVTIANSSSPLDALYDVPFSEPGVPLRISSSLGNVALANATDFDRLAVGLSLTETTYLTDGQITKSDWSNILDSSMMNLVSGATYYLSLTSGKLTNVAPSTGYVQVIGKALSETTLDIEIDAPIAL